MDCSGNGTTKRRCSEEGSATFELVVEREKRETVDEAADSPSGPPL